MDTVGKCGIIGLALFGLFLCPFGMCSGNITEKQACYNGIPESIKCNVDERIAIHDIYFENNCSNCRCFSDVGSSCEQFTLYGSWENTYYYNAVSGKQECQFLTLRTLCPNNGTERTTYTNQVYLRYECVIENKIIDFCAMSMQTVGETVYLQYTPSEKRHNIRDCHCYAYASSGGLDVHAVDIRFPYDSSGICSKNQNSYLQFDSQNQTLECIDKQLLGGYTAVYNTSNKHMDILLHLEGEPQSVWISITSLTGEKVKVSCENTPSSGSTYEAVVSTARTHHNVYGLTQQTSQFSGQNGLHQRYTRSRNITDKHSCYSGKTEIILCNDNERISIYNLQYERNCTSCFCANNVNSICEQFTLPGSWENYYYYNAVSGTQSSQFTTRRTPCPNSGAGMIYTNQVHFRYECIIEDKIIDFCAMSMQTEAESVYLQFTPSGNRHKKRDCHCSASTSSGGLEIHALDIRFPMDYTGICGINQKSYLQFDSGNQTIKCHDRQLIGGYTNIYNTSNQNVDILLHLDGEPQSVWIGITATTGTKVNISCENIPPTEFFSTEAIISSEYTTFDVETSISVKLTKNQEITKKPLYTTDERTARVMKTPSIGMVTATVTHLTSAHSTEHSSNISVIPPVSQNKLQEKNTKARMSTEKSSFGVMTSKPLISSKNAEKTKGPTLETRLTSAQSKKHLSTISVNPQKTLPDKKTTDQPIDPAIIVLALTSFLTFVLVVIGFVIGRSRYVKSRLHRKHCNTNQEEIQLDKKETGVNIKQNVHHVCKDDAI